MQPVIAARESASTPSRSKRTTASGGGTPTGYGPRPRALAARRLRTSGPMQPGPDELSGVETAILGPLTRAQADAWLGRALERASAGGLAGVLFRPGPDRRGGRRAGGGRPAARSDGPPAARRPRRPPRGRARADGP